MSATKQGAKRAERLRKAMGHPYRWDVLQVLSRKPVASTKELAYELRLEVNRLSYHVRELDKLGCIELVKTEQRRGATEHFYRATERAFFDDDEWLELPLAIRKGIVGQQLARAGGIINAAIDGGTFEGRADRHFTLLEYDVDEVGWKETVEILAEAEEKLIEAKAASAERLLTDQDQRIPVAVSMLGFERAKGREIYPTS